MASAVGGKPAVGAANPPTIEIAEVSETDGSGSGMRPSGSCNKVCFSQPHPPTGAARVLNRETSSPALSGCKIP